MSGTPEARGALVTSLIIRGLFFVILLAGVIGALLVYPLPAALILGALVFGAVIPIAIALPVIARRRRRQLQLAQQECPDAVIVRAEWNGVFMPSFVKDPAVLQGADPRGFVVLVARSDGLRLWRGARSELVTLGDLPWSEITDVDAGEVKPVIGKKAATLRITFTGESATLASPIELIVRGEPTSQALDRILAAREPNQEPHDR